jgi:Na+-transporting NADH:ubiquinone oxidoreductase subunit NqrF
MMMANLPAPSDDTVIFVCGPPLMELEIQKKLRELGHGRRKIISP